LLSELARQFPFIYVPRLYGVSYQSDGTLASVNTNVPDIPDIIQRAFVQDLDNAVFPTAPIIPHVETIHDRIAVEIMRGCPQRCDFCHAGHTRGPLRWRSVQKILDIARQSYQNTGHDTVSLLSLSTSDYPHLAQLVPELYDLFTGCHVSISLPSLRVDRQLRDVPAWVTGTRREGLTVAVEAASDRMRKAIGKRVTDTDLTETMRAAYEAGWRKVKLYFMVGFPEEKRDDISGITELAHSIAQLRGEVAGAPALVNASVSWLVPKPHTPFAWIPQQTERYFSEARRQIIDTKHALKAGPVKFKFHHIQRSLLEAVFARGDRRLSRVLENAYRNGARFDAWDEHFRLDVYQQAFQQCDLDPAFYSQRSRPQNELFPWDHLAGDNKPNLYQRLQRSLQILKNDK
jgi:radical SAM superfamily enzyme YgiQ (UPF0313 family)